MTGCASRRRLQRGRDRAQAFRPGDGAPPDQGTRGQGGGPAVQRIPQGEWWGGGCREWMEGLTGRLMSELETRLLELFRTFGKTSEECWEHELSSAIGKLCIKFESDPFYASPAVLAERIAFDFCHPHAGGDSCWGTYYHFQLGFSDGSVYPSIQQVSPEVLRHWEARARTENSLALKVRYADLVWDLSWPAAKIRPSVDMAYIVIDDSIRISQSGPIAFPRKGIWQLERALQVAIQLKDENRIASVRDALIVYEEGVSPEHGLGGDVFDGLIGNKKVKLTEAQEQKLVADAEAHLARTSNVKDTANFHPHVAKDMAMRLAGYYRKLSREKEVRRVLLQCQDAFLAAIATGADAITASAWLEQVYEIFREFELRDEADSVAVLLRQHNEKVPGELKQVSFETTVSTAEVERWLERMVSGSSQEALFKFAERYLPDFNKIAHEVREEASDTPLQSMMPIAISDDEGRTVATIGSVEDDFDGRVVHRTSTLMSMSPRWVRMLVEKFISTHKPTTASLVEALYESPLFDEGNRKTITAGLDAYLRNDHIVACYLLTPQLERVLRNLMKLLGRNIYKPRRAGGLQLKDLHEILKDKRVLEEITPRVAKYLEVLLLDQRGWNLRHEICHGMAADDHLNAGKADRIFHALVLLGHMRSRVASSKGDPAVEGPSPAENVAPAD